MLMPCWIHEMTCLMPSMTGWRMVLTIPQTNARKMRIFWRIHVMPSTILETTVMMPLTMGAVNEPMVVLSFLMLFCMLPAALL